ncbi:hypothetical protein A3860_17375 [Niastella vici]|uniref:Uncharacterized protein n=1 Tax=Niastella vici TaxID=1703345 RepID=A0A1V9G461_9BACT|nr:hypothetical protein [Niastella vici]OQP65435.1 hypothetical protein A3860_17375 [Niastella vici]
MQKFFTHDSYSDTIRLMPNNYSILYRKSRRWMLHIDLMVDNTLATKICQIMHDFDTAFQPIGSLLAARLDTLFTTPAVPPNASAIFEYMPATLWNRWPEQRITFYGSKGRYIVHDQKAYFIWDGCHVATLTWYNFLWHPNPCPPVPKDFKALAYELAPDLKEQLLITISLQHC